MGWISVNPCVAIDLPRARREEMLFLTADEVRAVAEAIDPQYRVLVHTAGWTGLRAGELAGLRWGDVDLMRGVLHVRRSVRDVNGNLEVGDLKTEQSRRTVSLPAFLKAMLTEHLTSAATGGTRADYYVFVMKGGGQLRHGLVYGRYFKRAVAGWTDGRGNRHPGRAPGGTARIALARPPAYLRCVEYRGGRAPEADLGSARSQLDPDHARPLRAPVPICRGGIGRSLGRSLPVVLGVNTHD